MENQVFYGDNLPVLKGLPSGSVNLVYIDPPFNTGKVQRRVTLRTLRSESGERNGFGGNRYDAEVVGSSEYSDDFPDYIAFLRPRLVEAHRVLAPDGSLYFHIDCREGHYCKLLLDEIFGGRDHFLNEIIWAYDYGGRPKDRWAAKHDNIFLYAKNPDDYWFDLDEVDRIEYMAPRLVGAEKAERGKAPTDTWWHTIVGTSSREKTGYPTQKPLGILRRIVRVSSRPGDLVLDFFAGSGTTGAACLELGRKFILVDNNKEALKVMADRFRGRSDTRWIGFDPTTKRPAPASSSSVPEPARGKRTHALNGAPTGRECTLADVVSEASDMGGKSMPDKVVSDQVKVLCIGVGQYTHLRTLQGPPVDARRVAGVLSTQSSVGLVAPADITCLVDPTLAEVQGWLTNYATSRLDPGEVLVFFFAGHGGQVGAFDYGFCMKDARAEVRRGGGLVSTSVLRVTDVVLALQAANVCPVFIIDACFAGMVARAQASPMMIPELVHGNLQRVLGSSYALVSACSPSATAHDTPTGGPFTGALAGVLEGGMGDNSHKRSPCLSIQDVFAELQGRIQKRADIPWPYLYVSPTFPQMDLVRNAQYSAIEYKFTPLYRAMVEFLWNKGTPRSATRQDFIRVSAGAYGNWSKLSRSPWNLMSRRKDGAVELTNKGLNFARGNEKIPRTVLDRRSPDKSFEPTPGTDMVVITDIPSFAGRRK